MVDPISALPLCKQQLIGVPVSTERVFETRDNLDTKATQVARFDSAAAVKLGWGTGTVEWRLDNSMSRPGGGRPVTTWCMEHRNLGGMPAPDVQLTYGVLLAE